MAITLRINKIIPLPKESRERGLRKIREKNAWGVLKYFQSGKIKAYPEIKRFYSIDDSFLEGSEKEIEKRVRYFLDRFIVPTFGGGTYSIRYNKRGLSGIRSLIKEIVVD